MTIFIHALIFKVMKHTLSFRHASGRRRSSCVLLLLFFMSVSLSAMAQNGHYRLHGTLPLPDGTTVGLLVNSDTAYAEDRGSTVLKGHAFELTGSVDRPRRATFITNNLDLVSRNHWSDDSIRWNYVSLFITNDDILITPSLKVQGGRVQSDFNDLLAVDSTGGESGEGDVWFRFIDSHPQSPVAVFLANRLLQRGYNLTVAQVDHLDSTLIAVPADSVGFAEFRQRLAAARKTVRGADLQDLELKTTDGKLVHLVDVVAEAQRQKPGYVLVDFWASWCGICLGAMPEIKQLATEYATDLTVVGVSIDTKDEAWKKSMTRHHEPWAQYCTTARGYKDLFVKYQVGNGVPYYLLIAPNGKVVSAMSGPEEVKTTLDGLKR